MWLETIIRAENYFARSSWDWLPRYGTTTHLSKLDFFLLCMWLASQSLWNIPEANVDTLWLVVDQVKLFAQILEPVNLVFRQCHHPVHLGSHSCSTLCARKYTIIHCSRYWLICSLTFARHISQNLKMSLWRPHWNTLSPVSYWTS